jgi:hypothetical protein
VDKRKQAAAVSSYPQDVLAAAGRFSQRTKDKQFIINQ